MIRHTLSERLLATSLAMLAGFVDALGFVELGGYFVSFMSGNSTRLGVGLAEMLSLAIVPLALIGLFVSGVVGGSFVGHFARGRRIAAVLAFVTTLLAVAGAVELIHLTLIAIALMAFSMGATNAAFERDGEVSIGVTYMTGALVKLGQRIAAALLGGARFAWLWYLLLWLGLTTGALLGALAHVHFGLDALWLAVAGATVLTIYAVWRQ